MAIADEFLYGNREQRRERRALRKKNRIERQLYKKKAKEDKIPKNFRKAVVKQMKVEDRGEMDALKNAQSFYGDLWSAQQDFQSSLGNLQDAERSTMGGDNITGINQYGDLDASINKNLVTSGVMDEGKVDEILDKDYRRSQLGPRKNIISNITRGIKQNIQNRKLKKQELKNQYNSYIEDMKLIEGENFDEERLLPYRKWKKKWKRGDFEGVLLEDHERVILQNRNELNERAKENVIPTKTIEDIEEEELAEGKDAQYYLDNQPESFQNFGQVVTWQMKAGDYKFKEGESVTVGGKKYTWKKSDGEFDWVAETPEYKNMSFRQAFRKARNAHGGRGGEFIWKGKYYHTGYGSEPAHTPSAEAKASWGEKKKGGMYQDGGFLDPPVPRLFE